MSSSRAGSRPRLLAVGAIERDNFGDLLYVHVLEHFCADRFDIELGAPIRPVTDLSLDRPVGLWPQLLDEERFDVAWTIGGEIGASAPEYAYLTTLGPSAHKSLERASEVERDRILAEAMGGSVADPPYIPRPALSARSAAASLVIASVGLSGVVREPMWRRPSLVAALREARFLSVRDTASSAALEQLGIEHHLAPDVAHVVADMHPVTRTGDGPILVHLSQHVFADHSIEDWAHTLHQAMQGVDGEIRLFLAGLAPAHDSLSRLMALRDRLLTLEQDRSVTVSQTRAVWDRVEEIAQSSLWIGGSLHGRIVASAYGVPRVSLAKPKVDLYARDWDPDQPYGVGPASLAAAVRQALAGETAPRADLARHTTATIESALTALQTPDGDDAETARRRARREELAALRSHARLLDRRLAARTAEVDRLRRERAPRA